MWISSENGCRSLCRNKEVFRSIIRITTSRASRWASDLPDRRPPAEGSLLRPRRQARPARPRPVADARPALEKFIAETLALLEPLKIEDSGPAHRHPWLGELNALQWCWLLAGHSGIHLNQLLAVKKSL